MTATLSKAPDINVEAYPAQVLSRGYSNAELKLIKDVWTQTKVVAKEAMQLCLNLYDLKTEMDANDPDAGNNPTKGSSGRHSSRATCLITSPTAGKMLRTG